MDTPRGLSREERALWERLAKTVTPLERRHQQLHPVKHDLLEKGRGKVRAAPAVPNGLTAETRTIPNLAPPPATLERHGLDASWERKLRTARVEPDFTLDLHGHSLDAAHARLDRGLAQARAMGARLVLLVTGKPRQREAADRGSQRGAIRAKVLDWLAAGPHGADIAAIRNAHRRHGGEGALYIVLKRQR